MPGNAPRHTLCRYRTVFTASGFAVAALAVHVGARSASHTGAWLLGSLLAWLVVVGGMLHSRPSMQRVLAVALAARLVLALCPPLDLSDDLYRYIHEGRAGLVDIALPYASPPSRITPIVDDGLHEKVAHADVAAAYPPQSQLVFMTAIAIGDRLGKPVPTMRWFLRLFDLVLLVALAALRRRRAMVAITLHPLLIFEVWLECHIDIVGVVALAFAFLVVARRPSLAGALLGFAFGIKPLAIIPLLLLAIRSRQRRRFIVGAATGLLLPLIPYLWVGAPLLAGVTDYAGRWQAYPTVFAVVRQIIDIVWQPDGLVLTLPDVGQSPAAMALAVNGGLLGQAVCRSFVSLLGDCRDKHLLDDTSAHSSRPRRRFAAYADGARLVWTLAHPVVRAEIACRRRGGRPWHCWHFIRRPSPGIRRDNGLRPPISAGCRFCCGGRCSPALGRPDKRRDRNRGSAS